MAVREGLQGTTLSLLLDVLAGMGECEEENVPNAELMA